MNCDMLPKKVPSDPSRSLKLGLSEISYRVARKAVLHPDGNQSPAWATPERRNALKQKDNCPHVMVAGDTG